LEKRIIPVYHVALKGRNRNISYDCDFAPSGLGVVRSSHWSAGLRPALLIEPFQGSRYDKNAEFGGDTTNHIEIF